MPEIQDSLEFVEPKTLTDITEERDQFLIEYLEPDLKYQALMMAAWLDMSEWERFGWFFKKTKEQPWFADLLYRYWSCPEPRKVFPYYFIDPDKFADSLYRFLKGQFPSPYLKNKERGKYDTGE